VRKSLRTRDWTKANREVQKSEADERVKEQGAPKTLADAWDSFLAEIEARKLSHPTFRKYTALRRQMEAFGKTHLADFDLDTLSKFRTTWKDGPRTSAKKLERLRAFLTFCLDRKWVQENPAKKIKQPIITLSPTMPLSHEEWKDLMDACDRWITTVQPEGKLGALRLRSLLLLMRYSGLRVSDAVTLTTDRLDGKKLLLYMQKTGAPVYTVLPESVVQVLEETPQVTETRLFLVRQWQAANCGVRLPRENQEYLQSRGNQEGIVQCRFSSSPRYFRCGAAAGWCADRARLDSTGTSKRASDREAL
jgi:integrase